MRRPLRIESSIFIYHVTSRGDRRNLDGEDRAGIRAVIVQAMDRLDARVLAYCRMSDRFHWVLHARQANPSRRMRQVNGVYPQRFNRRCVRALHRFQGRCKTGGPSPGFVQSTLDTQAG
jgi:REP element-mobilizing transposase RayT